MNRPISPKTGRPYSTVPAYCWGAGWKVEKVFFLPGSAMGKTEAMLQTLSDKLRQGTESMQGLAAEWRRSGARRKPRGKRARKASFAARMRAAR